MSPPWLRTWINLYFALIFTLQDRLLRTPTDNTKRLFSYKRLVKRQLTFTAGLHGLMDKWHRERAMSNC